MIQLYINGNAAYEKPQNPDKGPTFFPAMERNVQRMNDHVHDGVKGNYNPVITQSIASGSWALAPIGGGVYVQTVTMPAGMVVANFDITFRLANGNIIDLSVEPQSSNTYKVYINDNSQTVTAFYTS